ncbi:hypothetical protein HYE68_001098 [Fusarium pseudograminearum]|nr:hypothetical protein HYE68_001098 [Fusarium pseudograminearum]
MSLPTTEVACVRPKKQLSPGDRVPIQNGHYIPQLDPINMQLNHFVYDYIFKHTEPCTATDWQCTMSITGRMPEILNPIARIMRKTRETDYIKFAEPICIFECEVFHNSPTKQAYDREIDVKMKDFVKRHEDINVASEVVPS